MTKKERFYDKEIAPVLLELAKKCQDKGLSLLAVVEYGVNEEGGSDCGKTFCSTEDTTHEFRLYNGLVDSRGNVDNFMMALAQFTRKTKLPHSSIVLKLMGVEPNPDDRQ